MAVIHSYPSPPNAWRQKLMMMNDDDEDDDDDDDDDDEYTSYMSGLQVE